MWVHTIYEEIAKHLDEDVANLKTRRIVAQEIVLHALGFPFPESYQGDVVKDVILTDAGLDYTVEFRNKQHPASSKWRNEKISYYTMLDKLREIGCEWVVLAQLKRTRTVFAQFVNEKVRVFVLQWAQFYKPIADIFSERAHGDVTGKAEYSLIAKDGHFDCPVEDWHNYNSHWATVADRMRYKTTYAQMPRGWLLYADVQSEYGLKGVANENFSWAIWPRWVDNDLYPCASVPIPASAFIGILPARPQFDPEARDYAKNVRGVGTGSNKIVGPEPGHYTVEMARRGLLTFIDTSEKYEEANVIAA
ncbi:unnamed protein product [Aureobasidium mustum]|uniref:Uncharacterized protein n=1 Tax=Aureobasidium mustum TaxID=2773714 RepID=A0A9N8JRC3_9PEZI|nr:unnamed protein product [Aureobasidium mustum]